MKTTTNIQKLKRFALALVLSILCVLNVNSQTAWPKSKVFYTAPVGYGPGTAFFTKVIQPAMNEISLQYNVCFVTRINEADYININMNYIFVHPTNNWTTLYVAALNSGNFGKAGGKQNIQLPILAWSSYGGSAVSIAISTAIANPASSIRDLKSILLRNVGITATNALTLYPHRCKYYAEGGKKTDTDLSEDGQSFDGEQGIKFNVYPNPTSGSITIKSILTDAPEGVKFSIRNTLGQVVIQGNLEVDSNMEVNTQIDMYNLDNGLYFFEVFVNEERIIEKIVKQ